MRFEFMNIDVTMQSLTRVSANLAQNHKLVNYLLSEY